MPNVYTHFVTWISRGRRHHGSSWADIVSPPPPSTMAPGETFQPPWAPPSITWMDGSGSHSANFAFWSVTGGVNAYFSLLNTPPSATVGNSDMHATAWYIEGGGGGEGLFIDAFDVNQGIFVDDDFVTVTPDASLTAAANADGYVPTTSTEHINAATQIHNVPFYDWTVVSGTEPVSMEDLQALARSSAIAFAFYQTPTGGTPFRPGNYEIGTWVSWGVMVDGGGPTGAGPVPPWNPFVFQFAAGLALAEAANKVSPQLRSKVLDLAAQQVSIATRAIEKSMQAGNIKATLAAKKKGAQVNK